MYAMIATVLIVGILQTVNAAPACLCMDHGISCLNGCITDTCANRCDLEKIMCYKNCRRSKKDATMFDTTMFDALADEYMLDN